jgi:Domain of unknown function (DUF1844)
MAEEKKDFVVRDRRIFSEDSQEATKKPTGESKAPPDGEQAKREAGQSGTAHEQRKSAPQFPEINFSTFVVSLNASALVHLGAIEDPAAGKQAKNLPMAKQTIDILSMLEKKTTGNLTHDEEQLIKSILYDLRILYVKEKS